MLRVIDKGNGHEIVKLVTPKGLTKGYGVRDADAKNKPFNGGIFGTLREARQASGIGYLPPNRETRKASDYPDFTELKSKRSRKR